MKLPAEAFSIILNYAAPISNDILIEGREIAAVLRFEVPSVMAVREVGIKFRLFYPSECFSPSNIFFLHKADDTC